MAHSNAGIIVALAALVTLTAGAPAYGQSLSFDRAREMVFESHQGLKAMAEEHAASEEAVRQAGAYPNPELEAEAKDFGRSEIEVVLTQPLLIGGKRGAAIEVASWGARIAGLGLESARISVEAELLRRYVPVLGVYRRIALIDSTILISDRSIAAVRRLVEAGATMEVDMLRAQLERDEFLLERADLERDLYEAELKLSELWGDDTFVFEEVEGSVPVGLALPPVDVLGLALEAHPEVRILDARGRLAEAGKKQAKAEAAPEFALSAGYHRDNEVYENAAIVGLSFSLPIFNRNKGAVAEKQHERAAAEHEARQVRLERSADLAALYSTFEVRGRELDTISGEVLARATLIHQTLSDFYLRGKVGILDVLAARAHLLDLHMRIVDLSEERAVLAADIQELTGYPIDVIE